MSETDEFSMLELLGSNTLPTAEEFKQLFSR